MIEKTIAKHECHGLILFTSPYTNKTLKMCSQNMDVNSEERTWQRLMQNGGGEDNGAKKLHKQSNRCDLSILKLN